MKLVRIRTDTFTAGFLSDGVIRKTTKQVKFMLGWPEEKARATIHRNGWSAGIVTGDDPALLAAITEEPKSQTSRPRLVEPDPPPPPVIEPEHYCRCGKWGSFGYEVSWRRGFYGVWYCGEHRPSEDKDEENENSEI